MRILALILVGLSVGLDNFAVSIAIGLSKIKKSTRILIALVFGIFETGMPLLGLLIGHQFAKRLGEHSNLIGGILLILAGIYVLINSYKKKDPKLKDSRYSSLGKLLITGLALSIDNLIVGFSLGAHKEPIVLTIIVIGITSVVLALLGLEIGSRLGSKVEEYSEAISGIILIIVGFAIGLNIL